jgi:hypothetical protein
MGLAVRNTAAPRREVTNVLLVIGFIFLCEFVVSARSMLWIKVAKGLLDMSTPTAPYRRRGRA